MLIAICVTSHTNQVHHIHLISQVPLIFVHIDSYEASLVLWLLSLSLPRRGAQQLFPSFWLVCLCSSIGIRGCHHFYTIDQL